MRVAVGADHAGHLLRRVVIEFLKEQDHEVIDVGTDSAESVDYPDYARAVAMEVASGQAERGVLICGSGAGVSVAANKFKGVRAATVHDCYTAHQCVEHDDVNVACLGAQVIGTWLALDIVRLFVEAKFSYAERHVRRLNKVKAFDEDRGGQ
jgi:ribose 5-phosphate isomerase B